MSFRQFGGLQYAARNNIVSSNYSTNSNLQVTQNVGQSNSYINFLSDISGTIDAPGGITGATGSFTYLSGGTGYFTYLTSIDPVLIPSDYRIKENVTPLNDTYVVDELIPVTYTNTLTERQDMGLIAHELQEVYPFLVNGEKDGKEYQSVNYTSLIPLLIKEIKELKEKVKSIQEKITK